MSSPSTTTPPPAGIGAGMPRPKGQPAKSALQKKIYDGKDLVKEYRRQLQNEHNAIQGYIEKWIKTPAASTVPREARLLMLHKMREVKLEERSFSRAERVAVVFPRLFDPDEEDSWLKKTFREYLAGGDMHITDRDDEECPPESIVKGEHVDNQMQERVKHETSSPDGGKHRRQLVTRVVTEDKAKREQLVILSICSRAYPIRHGCSGLKILEQRRREAREEDNDTDEPDVSMCMEVVSRAYAISGDKRDLTEDVSDRSPEEGNGDGIIERPSKKQRTS